MQLASDMHANPSTKLTLLVVFPPYSSQTVPIIFLILVCSTIFYLTVHTKYLKKSSDFSVPFTLCQADH